MSSTGGESPNRAPGDLEIVRSFVNTVDIESGADEIATPEALGGWFRDRGLGDGSATTQDLDRAVELREALRDVLSAHSGEGDEATAIRALDAFAAGIPMTLRFTSPDEVVLVPSAAGADQWFGRLLAIVAAALADGSWSRLKACLRDDCRWAFFDSARNRSGKWCSMAVCGNRTKAQKFRQRRTVSPE